MANQFTEALTDADLIAVSGMRVKSMPEEVLSLPLIVEPAYPVVSGTPIFLTDDKKACTTDQNVNAGYVGAVVLHQVGMTGKNDTYAKGDVVPVMVKGKLWVAVADKVTDLGANVGVQGGTFSTGGTQAAGARWHGESVGSKNLAIAEFTGV